MMRIVKAGLLAATLLVSGVAQAQGYPAKQVIFISSVAGGASDAYVRAVLDKVRENTGVPMIFEGRPGGSGAPALQALKSAAPDGYTLGITYASAMNLNPQINRDLKIDPLKDFLPVSNLMTLGTVIAVRDDFPAKTLPDLVAMAKAKPGAVRVAVFGAGNRAWLAQLEEAAGVKFTAVPFKTTTESMAATLGGHIESSFETAMSVAGQKGKLRALAFGGLSPSAQLPPGVPLVRDLYRFNMLSWFGVIAPVGTPAPAVQWMSRELGRAVQDPKVRALIESGGLVPLGDTPEEFGRLLKTEVEANAELVRKFPDIR